MKNIFQLKMVIGAAVALIFTIICFIKFSSSQTTPSEQLSVSPSDSATEPTVVLKPSQVNSIKIEPVETYLFSEEKEGIGRIDFDHMLYSDINLSVQVFPPCQGTIVKNFVELGDNVQKEQPLYSIKSSDLLQAETSLLAISQQHANDDVLKAARNAVRVYGKTDKEINQIIDSHKVDPVLIVRSPISGQITSVNAQPGIFVQTGTAPAPCTVAEVTVKWLLANVPESDSPYFHVDQPVKVNVPAYPNRIFEGKVSKIYPTVDSTNHRVTVRCDILDPNNELRSGMLANFIIRVRGPFEAVAVPINSVVRKGDGTMTVWVTTDRHNFTERRVKLGIRKDDYYEVVEGLKLGEQVVSDGAIFLSNILEAPQND